MKLKLSLILFIMTSTLYGQLVLDDSMILNLVRENNLGYKTARINEKSAYQNYMISLSDKLPQIDFTTDPNALGYPLYSYQFSRDPITGDDVIKHRIGAGISLSQQLPGGGRLSLSLKNRLDIENQIDGEVSEYSQSPNVSLLYNQSLLYNGTFMDFTIHNAQSQLNYLGFLKAEKNTKNLENSIIFTAFSLAWQVEGLRRNNVYLEESIKIHMKDLEDLTIKKEQGRASETDLLSLKLNIGKKRQQLLESRYILQEAEQNLFLFLGLDSEIDQLELDLDNSEIKFPGEELEMARDYTQMKQTFSDEIKASPQIALKQLALQEVSVANKLKGLEFASSLSLFASLAPLYPFQRDDPDNLSNSLSQFWSAEGSLDYSIGLSLSIPLFDGNKAIKQAEISQNNEKAALISLEETRQNVENSLKSLLSRRQILREQIDQLKLNIEFENLMLKKEADLFVLGGSTQTELIRVELDVINLENDLARAKAELFLNTLDITSLLGYDLEEFLENKL